METLLYAKHEIFTKNIKTNSKYNKKFDSQQTRFRSDRRRQNFDNEILFLAIKHEFPSKHTKTRSSISMFYHPRSG